MMVEIHDFIITGFVGVFIFREYLMFIVQLIMVQY